MSEPNPEDIIDWSASPQELRFAIGLDPVGASESTVVHELVVRFRKTSLNTRFAVRFKENHISVPVRTEVEANGAVELRFQIETSTLDADDELELELLEAGSSESRPIRIRRTRCQIETALIHPRAGDDLAQYPLGDHVRAALLWYGWNRCSQLIGIKRIDTGLSGNEVFVFRPRLSVPRLEPGGYDPEDFVGCSPKELWTESWGAWLLVKAGEVRKIHKEWSRHEVFLRDRLTPFMARTEVMLQVHPAERSTPAVPAAPDRTRKSSLARRVEPSEQSRGRATLISSFLGGDLIRAEPLEFRLQGGKDPESCRRVIARAFETLAPWYHPGQIGNLGEFGRFFKIREGVNYLFGPKDAFKDQPGKLAYDLSKPDHRELFYAKVPHLLRGLFDGKKKDGLLARLRTTKVRHGMIHGDLNPRNILCDRDYAWLIDFEHAGYGPTLHDFAWLEANLRYFCLSLAPDDDSLDEAAIGFERHLLDHLHGSESSLEPVRRWAKELGTDPDQLYKLASAIVEIRQLALPYCVDDYADHRDYLAVLFLAVLSLLRGDREMNAPPANYRVLVRLAWVLEEQLSRIHGLEPADPKRTKTDLRNLVDAEWLRATGAPGRVDYLTRSAEGARALGLLTATRGVRQGKYHHLDVFDHTLSVLAYVEALIESHDPLAGFLDPGQLDKKVSGRLAEQGLHFPSGVTSAGDPLDPETLGSEFLDAARAALREALDDESRLLLKWCALLHDVGKPGVRSMSARGRFHVIEHAVYGLRLLEDHLPKWFNEKQARRLRHLIYCHHDHYELTREDHQDVDDLKKLRQFVIKPTSVPYKDFQRQWSLLEAVITREPEENSGLQGFDQPIDEFPLLILHGFADSLASRGHHYLTPLGLRAELYLVFLAAWHRRDCLASIRKQWLLCRDRVKEKENPDLHRIISPPNETIDPARQRILGQLPEWAWKRVQDEEICPTLEEFADEARRRLEEMTLLSTMPGEPESPVSGGAGSP